MPGIIAFCSVITLYIAVKMSSLRESRTAYPFAWKANHPPVGVGARKQKSLFDALTATAHELQGLLTNGSVSSADIVKEYIWRIEEHNPYLNAVFEYAPDVLERASSLDSMRKGGQILGPLHGIPVLIKVSLLIYLELK